MGKQAKTRRWNEEAIAIVALNVRKYRLAKGYTIKELSNLMGADYSQIGRLERGVANPHISIIFDIATALEIEPARLLDR